jgi:hypothetical protein
MNFGEVEGGQTVQNKGMQRMGLYYSIFKRCLRESDFMVAES